MDIKRDLDICLQNFCSQFPKDLFKDKEIYARWLAQTYYFVSHSTPLLGYALPFLNNKGLQHHFEHHLGEEEKHDLMALKDLERLGYSIRDIPEYAETQAFYQSQYYRIQFQGGTSMLGYILFLEALAVNWGREGYEQIKDLHKGSVLFLKVHSEEDPHHVLEAIRAIEGLSMPEQEKVCENLHYTSRIYVNLLNRICQESTLARQRKEKLAA